ncbi:MAG: thioredoxin-disulfide reductase [Spirochaetaceae bacterium]|nr:thioredoxin-disulfide reductase [Spirochaetaceae bacterium]
MENTSYDFIIIGAGVAGLSAAGYAARANLNTLVLELGGSGGQAQNIMHLENYPGLYPAISGTDFIIAMKNQAQAFGANIVTAQVQSVGKKDDSFYVRTGDKEYNAPTVLLATGSLPRKLGCPGEKELSGRGVSYCATCDGPFFRNKKIIVVGGGDSACDEATFLSTLSDDITLVHRKSQFRAQKAVADRVLQNPRIKVKFNTVVTQIRGQNKVQSVLLKNTVTEEEQEQTTDAVFVFIGAEPSTELMPILAHDTNGYIITNEEMATAIPGLFCAGDVRAKPFRQVVTAAADGAVAAHSAAKYIRNMRNEAYL